MRFSGLSWTKDAKGFFYSRYPEPPQGKALEAALSGQALYYHRVGTPQSQDVLVYERKDLPTWFVGGQRDRGRPLPARVPRGRVGEQQPPLLRRPRRPAARRRSRPPVKPVVEQDDAEYAPFGNQGSLLFVRTDRDAPNRKVIAIDLADPGARRPGRRSSPRRSSRSRASRSSAAASSPSTSSTCRAGCGCSTPTARRRRDRAAGHRRPGRALADARTRRRSSTRSPRRSIPTTVFSYDPSLEAQHAVRGGARRPSTSSAVRDEGSSSPTSKDGTRVPFFLTARKDLAARRQPTRRCCTATAAFRCRMPPTYRADVPAWLEQGGVWVTANMRGGAEYGEAWHKAGMLEKKQNVFDDFIAVAEQLVAREIHLAGEARDHGRLERRPARRRGDGAAAGSVRRRAAGGRRDGHAALRPVHRRPRVGRPSTARRRTRRSSRPCSSTRRCTTSSRAPAIRRRSSPRPTTTTASCRATRSSSPRRCRRRRAATSRS